MKYFSKFLISTILYLILSVPFLKAQTIQVIDPTNAAASATEITSLLGGMINVSAAQIEAFYNELLIPDYNPGCPHPEASTTNMDGNSASFQWPSPAPPGGSTFVAYMRLSNGLKQTTSTNNNYINLVNLPNDIYLVAFQSTCGSFKSALDIIILDKPIMFGTNDKCLCDYTAFQWAEPVDNGHPDSNNVDDPDDGYFSNSWLPGQNVQNFYIEFHRFQSLYDKVSVELTFEGNTPVQLRYNSDCPSYIVHNPDLSYLQVLDVGADPDIIGTMFFAADNSFSFVSTGYGEGEIKMYKCLNDDDSSKKRNQTKSPLGTEQLKFQSLSNPFTNNTFVQYTLPEDLNISLFLLDALGNKIKTFKQQEFTKAGIHKIDINLHDSPNGMYTCILKTDTELIPLKLLKIE